MAQDLFLVIGIILLGVAIPSILGAWADRRAPRVAAVTVMIGGSLILLALSQKPGAYGWAEIPEAFIRVVAQYIW